MKKLALGFLTAAALFASAPAFAQTPAFITTATGPVGSPILVTVYLPGVPPVPATPGSITWTGPTNVVCSPMGTGFSCLSTTIGFFIMKATHSSGTFANLTLNVTAGLQFSSP